MYRNQSLKSLALLGALSFVFACTASETKAPPANDAGVSTPEDAGAVSPDGMVVTPPGEDAGTPPVGNDTGVTGPVLPESDKARVKFKRQNVLARELARALDLPPDGICNELDRFNCFEVHAIPLGGVEPYNLGINEPLESTVSTTPLAVERAVLSGCRNRVDQDILAGPPVIFDLDVTDDGALDLDSPKTEASIQTLYRRVLIRDAVPAEVEHLKSFYAEVADGGQPVRNWAILSCFAVATTMEALFY